MRVNTLKCNTLYVGRSGDLSSSVSSTALAAIGGVTAGTVTASKACIVDASKDLGGFNDITCGAIDTVSAEALVIGAATATGVTIGATDAAVTVVDTLNVGSSGNAGEIRIFPATASKSYAKITSSNHDGTDDFPTLNFMAQSDAFTINLPDPGATAYVAYLAAEADQTLIASTPAEIDTICDRSAWVVAQAAGNFSFAAGTHNNKLTLVEDADVVITLPAATGSGNVYYVVFGLACTGALISVTGNDTFFGGCMGVDDDADAAYAWKAEASDNEVNLNGTSTGGAKGDWFRFTDAKTDEWYVEGFVTNSGGSEATPFDAA
jgi:hypothetical protein